MRAVLVTGVSTGIGYATVQTLVAQGFHVFGSVRKPYDATRLAQEFGAAFTPLLFDVTDVAAIRSATTRVREALKGKPLAGLVNNAGIRVTGPLLQVALSDAKASLEVNVLGTLRVIQAFAPLLRSRAGSENPPGRIINIGSVVGKLAYPFMGPYTISKYALEGLTDTLRQEMMLYGIPVVLIGPGLVDTPLFDKGVPGETLYSSKDFDKPIQGLRLFFQQRRKHALSPTAVAALVAHALTVSRPKNRYVIASNRLLEWTLPRLLPSRLMNSLISKQFGLTRN